MPAKTSACHKFPKNLASHLATLRGKQLAAGMPAKAAASVHSCAIPNVHVTTKGLQLVVVQFGPQDHSCQRLTAYLCDIDDRRSGIHLQSQKGLQLQFKCLERFWVGPQRLLQICQTKEAAQVTGQPAGCPAGQPFQITKPYDILIE